MLYNPDWDIKTGDKFSLDTLIAWLERQPADGVYNYRNGNKCLLAQYYTEMYGEPISVGGYGWHSTVNSFRKSAESPVKFWRIALDGGELEWTFGKALERARAYQNA